jgi:hypothetical protein
MRRKTEILKYSSARMSTQTNSLTKKQTYSGLVKGSIPSITSNQNQCYDLTRPTLTSASGVPGPAMYLYNDPSVPLYNYATGNRSYGLYMNSSNYQWNVIEQNDVIFDSSSNAKVFQLQITNIVEPSYKYAVSVPIGLSISSTINTSTATQIKLRVYDIQLIVNYTGKLVEPIYYSTIPEIAVLISIPNLQTTSFSFVQYIGNAVFPNIDLYTQTGYEYTMYITAKIQSTIGTTNVNILLNRKQIISNMSPTTANTYTNCILSRITPAQSGNSGFIFTDAFT